MAFNNVLKLSKDYLLHQQAENFGPALVGVLLNIV